MSIKYYATLNHRKARVLGYLPGRPVFQPCVATEISEDAYNDPLTKSLANSGELTLHTTDAIKVAVQIIKPVEVIEVTVDVKPEAPAPVVAPAIIEEAKTEVTVDVKPEQPAQKKRKK